MKAPEILRQLIGTQFNINPKHVILSGMLKETKTFTSRIHWSNQFDQKIYRLWGFHPEKGFINLDKFIGQKKTKKEGTLVEISAIPICDIPNIEKYLFFIVQIHSISGKQNDEKHTIQLHTAPDFPRYWEKIEERDIERWANWLERASQRQEVIELEEE